MPATCAGSYAGEVAELQEVKDTVAQLDHLLQTSETKAASFSANFQKFSALWRSELQAALQVVPLCEQPVLFLLRYRQLKLHLPIVSFADVTCMALHLRGLSILYLCGAL